MNVLNMNSLFDNYHIFRMKSPELIVLIILLIVILIPYT